jgi:hypothetical protein
MKKLVCLWIAGLLFYFKNGIIILLMSLFLLPMGVILKIETWLSYLLDNKTIEEINKMTEEVVKDSKLKEMICNLKE